MFLLDTNQQPLINYKRKIHNIFQELTFYKEMLYSLRMSYRIHNDEATLTSIRLVEKLHDTTLSMARQKHTQTEFIIRNDMDFENAIQLVLG